MKHIFFYILAITPLLVPPEVFIIFNKFYEFIIFFGPMFLGTKEAFMLLALDHNIINFAYLQKHFSEDEYLWKQTNNSIVNK